MRLVYRETPKITTVYAIFGYTVSYLLGGITVMSDTTTAAMPDHADAHAAFEAHYQRMCNLAKRPVRAGAGYSDGVVQNAWWDFLAGIEFAQKASPKAPPADQGIIDCFTKAGVWLGVAPDEVARNVQAVKLALEKFSAPAPVELDSARADERVPGIGHPTTYRDLARLSPITLWNRWYPHDRSVNAREAFIAARALPFVASEEVVHNAARYEEVRQRAYHYGVGNPTPGHLDVLVDAGIAARSSAPAK